MICDYIENLDRYIGTHPRFAAAFPFLKELLADPNLTLGRHDMSGCDVENAVYANVSGGETTPYSDKARLEMHRKYIDIQIGVEGEEAMYCPGVGEYPICKEYDEAGDYELATMDKESCVCLNLKAGMFAIFFAGEGHAPCLAVNDKSCKVKKVIGKVLN